MSYYLSCTKEDVEALKGSIKKWKDIISGARDHGPSDCPLCGLYFEYCCEGCPISEWADHLSCSYTPYIEWCEHTRWDHFQAGTPRFIECPECKKLAIKELNFLKDLLKVCKVEL